MNSGPIFRHMLSLAGSLAFVFLALGSVDGTKDQGGPSNLNPPQSSNSCGWTITHWRNEFGDELNERYMTNANPVIGKFSNSATQDSPLAVRVLVSDSNMIWLMLYEYAQTNPVKAFGDRERYKLRAKTDDGGVLELTATNTSDRLLVEPSLSLHQALVKNKTVKVYLVSERYSNTHYYFEIDASGYTAVFKQMRWRPGEG